MSNFNLSSKIKENCIIPSTDTSAGGAGSALPICAVKEFIGLLKEEVTKIVHSDKQTKVQWIYKRIDEKLQFKIDKLAGEELI